MMQNLYLEPGALPPPRPDPTRDGVAASRPHNQRAIILVVGRVLQLREGPRAGDVVRIRSITMAKGTYVKFRPQVRHADYARRRQDIAPSWC